MRPSPCWSLRAAEAQIAGPPSNAWRRSGSGSGTGRRRACSRADPSSPQLASSFLLASYDAPVAPLTMLTDTRAVHELPAIRVDRGWRDTMASGRVLVAEDDKSVRDSLVRALTFEGYEVSTAEDGAEALMAVVETQPDAILLDVLMPHVDGLTACRKLRERGDRTPVLMLTARHEVSDRVAGLDAGADDYLVKPFALDELLARLRALLRRTNMSEGSEEVLRVGDLSLDPARRQA